VVTRRPLALVVLALALLGGCSAASLQRSDVAGVVEGAFGAAGLGVQNITVADAPVDGRWPVTATVSKVRLHLQVDALEGRVTSIDLAEHDVVSRAALQRIAAYSSNPTEERAASRRRLILVLLVAAGITVGLLTARHFRLREEAQLRDQALVGGPNARDRG